MAITIDWGTKVISVPQSDLTLVIGNLYELDTNVFRLTLKSLEDDEAGMPYPRTHIHNTEVTVAGTTFARTVEIINGYSVTFEDTGSAYGVRFVGSNNNIWDAENGILNVTAKVSYIPTNSAGLIVVQTTDAAVINAKLDTLITAQDLTNEQASAEHTTSRTTGLVILRNTSVMRRWEAPAYEDETQLIAYGTNPNVGIESVGLLVEVAWS